MISPFSQSQLAIYEDVETGLFGFIENERDTVHIAQFTTAYPLNRNRYTSYRKGEWLVSKNERWGLINSSGDISLPITYDKIWMNNSPFLVVKKDNKLGILDIENKVKHPIQFDEVERIDEISNCLKFKIGPYWGAFNENFDIVLPAKYEYISDLSESFSLYRTTMIVHYFGGSVDKRTTIVDSIGKVVIPPLYESVSLFVGHLYCDTPTIYFQVTKNGKSGLCTEDGELVIPIRHKQLYIYHPIYSCEKPAPFFVIGSTRTTNKNFHKVYCMDNGRESKVYDRIDPFCSYFVFQEGKKYGILNQNLEEIYSGSKYKFSNQLIGDMSSTCRSDQLQKEDSILFQVKPVKDNGENGSSRSMRNLRGVLNYYTGKSIPIDYHYITIKYQDGNYYYWAIRCDRDTESKYNPQYDHKGELDIYNSNMELIKTFSYNWILNASNTLRYISPKYEQEIKDFNLLPFVIFPNLFQNNEEKVGAISASGEITIPFEYEFAEPGDQETVYLKLKKARKSYHIDMNGVLTIDE